MTISSKVVDLSIVLSDLLNIMERKKKVSPHKESVIKSTANRPHFDVVFPYTLVGIPIIGGQSK